MRASSFAILVGVTLAAALGAGFVAARGDRAEAPPFQPIAALPQLAGKLGDLAWMRLSRGAMTADFGAIGGRWAVVEKDNYPAAPGRVHRLLVGLADLRLIEPKTRRAALLARLDLDDPQHGKATLIQLQDRGGATVAELIVGKSRPDLLGSGDGGVYVRKPGSDQAWLARGTLDVSGAIADWLDRLIVDVPASRIVSVALTGADGAALVLQRDLPGGAFAVADAPADAKFKDAAALQAPAAALADLELDDVRPAVVLPVPDSGVARAVFTTADGLTVTLRLVERDKVDWVAVEAAGSGAATAEANNINTRVGRWRYAIPAARSKLLRTRLDDLLQPAKGS